MNILNTLINKLSISSNFKSEQPSPSFNSFTASDAAAALSGLSGAEYWLTYMYLTADYSDLNSVYEYVFENAINLSIRENWKLPTDKPIIKNFSESAITELLSEKICPNCSGHGKYLVEEKSLIRDCEKCHGTGMGNRMTDKQRSENFGIGLKNYLRYWKIRYNKVSQIPYEALENGLQHAIRRLK